MATVWVVFSVIMLLLFGWGTKENGLILYALYFGWAFLVLLFQLLEKIEEKLHVRFLLPFVTACAVAALLAINIPAIKELLDFAIIYYEYDIINNGYFYLRNNKKHFSALCQGSGRTSLLLSIPSGRQIL